MGTSIDFSQIQQLIEQTTQSVSKAGTGKTGSSSQISQVSIFLNDAEAYKDIPSEENTGEKVADEVVSKIKSVASYIFSLLTANEAQAAKEEEAKNTSAANNLESTTDATKQDLQKRLQSIFDQMGEYVNVITDSLSSVEDLQAAIGDKQEELEAKLQELEDEQNALEECKPEERKDHLDRINELSKEISELFNGVQDVSEDIEGEQDNVDQAEGALDQLNSFTESEITSGIQQIQQLVQTAATEGVNNGEMTGKGTLNKVNSQLAQQLGNTTGWIPFVGSAFKSQCERVSQDQSSASDTRLPAAIQNIATLGKGLGNLGGATDILNSFTNSIGLLNNDFANIMGSFGSIVEDTITSIGSWDGVGDVSTELAEHVKTDLERLDGKEGNEGSKTSSKGESDKSDNDDSENSDDTPDLETVEYLRSKPFGV